MCISSGGKRDLLGPATLLNRTFKMLQILCKLHLREQEKERERERGGSKQQLFWHECVWKRERVISRGEGGELKVLPAPSTPFGSLKAVCTSIRIKSRPVATRVANFECGANSWQLFCRSSGQLR